MAKPTKSNKNTSKTARVLGLLTSPPPEEEPEDASSQSPAGESARRERAPAPPRPFSDSHSDIVVEDEVRDALEQALEGKLLTEEDLGFEPVTLPEVHSEMFSPQREPDPEPSSASSQEPELFQPPELGRGPEPAPAVDLTAAVGPASGLDDVFCFNVTQALVEAKVDKYIELFGLCRCPRCRIDVIALALSNLPPKYVVARHHEAVPMLSVYEGKYNAAIISQVMNACKVVMEHPRHQL